MWHLKKMIVKEVHTNVQIDVGAPTPTLLSNEHEIYLIFYVQKQDSNWDGSTINVRSSTDEGIVTIRFSKYAQFKFGSPNDESISGHLLYNFGLRPYTIQEVEKSTWIEELIKMNSVHPYHKDSLFDRYRHYIFFFHDSCFEIVCESFEIMNDIEDSMKKEIKRISEFI